MIWLNLCVRRHALPVTIHLYSICVFRLGSTNRCVFVCLRGMRACFGVCVLLMVLLAMAILWIGYLLSRDKQTTQQQQTIGTNRLGTTCGELWLLFCVLGFGYVVRCLRHGTVWLWIFCNKRGESNSIASYTHSTMSIAMAFIQNTIHA